MDTLPQDLGGAFSLLQSPAPESGRAGGARGLGAQSDRLSGLLSTPEFFDVFGRRPARAHQEHRRSRPATLKKGPPNGTSVAQWNSPPGGTANRDPPDRPSRTNAPSLATPHTPTTATSAISTRFRSRHLLPA